MHCIDAGAPRDDFPGVIKARLAKGCTARMIARLRIIRLLRHRAAPRFTGSWNLGR